MLKVKKNVTAEYFITGHVHTTYRIILLFIIDLPYNAIDISMDIRQINDIDFRAYP